MIIHILGSLASALNFVSLNTQVLSQNTIVWSQGSNMGYPTQFVDRPSSGDLQTGEFTYNHYQVDSNNAYTEYYCVNVPSQYTSSSTYDILIGSANTYIADDFGNPFVYTARFSINGNNGATLTINRNYNVEHLVNAVIDIDIVAVHTIQNNIEGYVPFHFSIPLFNNESYSNNTSFVLTNDYPQNDVYYSVFSSLHIVDMDTIRQYYENIGYNEGYDIGFDEGESIGYYTGYEDGKADGYNLGQSSGNSFRSLFSTLIDTPIIYLRKLFDYELFGISMFTALTTVISLIVALSIFRLVRGIF